MRSAVSFTAKPEGRPARGPAACAIVIPAFNEVDTVGAVVASALASAVGPVWVIDDGSSDGTATAARKAGAQVLTLAANVGKGGALLAAAESLEADVLVLLDADLVGLEPQHVRDLAEPVQRGRADMTRGVFKGGRWRTTTAQRLTPQLNGQRVLWRRQLLAVPGLRTSRYGVEIALGKHARRQRWRCRDVPLPGVSQVMKEEKRGLLTGISLRLAMYRDILKVLVRGGREGA